MIRIHCKSTFGFARQIEYSTVTVVCLHCFSPILHILIIHNQDYVYLQQLYAMDVFLKSFIIVSTHRRRHVASDTGY